MRKTNFVLASVSILLPIFAAAIIFVHTTTSVAKADPKDFPTRIKIASQAIDLPVETGRYNSESGQWQISEESSFFAIPTETPNASEGNTLIYAHNRPSLFGKTLLMKPGETISVETTAGKLYEYQVESAEDVSPANVSILSYKGKPQLTLLTCSGNNDSTRRLTHAKFLRVLNTKEIAKN